MNEQQNGEQQPRSELPGEEAGARESAPRHVGRGVAWLALLLALASSAAAGWLAWQRWQAERRQPSGASPVEALSERLDQQLRQQARRVEELTDEVADAARRAGDAESLARRLESRVEASRERFEQSDGRLDALRAEIEALHQRVDRLSTQIAAADSETGAPVRLALAEIEYLVQVAYRILALDADVDRALRALRQAASQLSALDLVGAENARKALAREIEALSAVTSPDYGALAGRLAALADRVDRLPLADSMPKRPRNEEPTAGETNGWWDASRQFLGRYFTVRRTDQSGTTLPAPESLTLARQLLRLELAQARAALLRRDGDAYVDSLNRAEKLLAGHFAPGKATQGFRTSLEELADVTLQPALPETGAALEAVSALRARHGEGS